MEQPSQKIRNKGVAVSALIRDGKRFVCRCVRVLILLTMLVLTSGALEQERYWMHDPYLKAALDDTYQYITTKVDPVLTKVLEEVLLYQPDQTADFLANAVRGTLNLKKYNYVVRKALSYSSQDSSLY